MMKVLSADESAKNQRNNWNALEPGSLFDDGRWGKNFIVVSKTAHSVEVIELDAENVQRILRSEQCVTENYGYDEIRILNLNGPCKKPANQVRLPKFDRQQVDLG